MMASEMFYIIQIFVSQSSLIFNRCGCLCDLYTSLDLSSSLSLSLSLSLSGAITLVFNRVLMQSRTTGKAFPIRNHTFSPSAKHKLSLSFSSYPSSLQKIFLRAPIGRHTHILSLSLSLSCLPTKGI